MAEQKDSPSIFQAMAAVMADVRSVAKDGRNASQGFNFRGIDGVLNAVGPALRKHGVFLAPCIGEHSSEMVEIGKNRTPMRSVTVVVSYTFHGPAGDHVTTTVPGEATDSGDKAFSKAMSVALRTALIQTFALPTDEKDPDQDTYERSPREQAAPPQSPPPQRNGSSGNGNGTQAPAKPPAEKAREGADMLLGADNQKRVDALVGYVPNSGAADQDVTKQLTNDDRAVLGLDAGDKMTLGDLADTIAGYWAKHGLGPRMQQPAGVGS